MKTCVLLFVVMVGSYVAFEKLIGCSTLENTPIGEFLISFSTRAYFPDKGKAKYNWMTIVAFLISVIAMIALILTLLSIRNQIV